MRKLIIVTLIALLCGVSGYLIRAQSTAPYAIGVNSGQVLANCPAPVNGTTYYCYAFDAIYQSQNGGAYTKYGLVTAGVTSWNGLTGVVTYTPPAPLVSSVNGKTGAVVLGATTTVQ